MKLITTLLLLSASLFSIAQTPNLEQMRKIQDRRKTLFDQLKNREFAIHLTTYVNPFIGTGGNGHTYPGASAPFGMMQLSPDTRPEGWDGCGGYHYSDSILYGFSHTHLSGTGIPDYGDLLVCPQAGIPQTEPGYLRKGGYGHKFSHDSEEARPGYYKVQLPEQGITAEMTVTKRAGMHRYTFAKAPSYKYLLLDLDYRDKVISANFNILDKQTIAGHRVSSAWAEEQHFYFYIRTSVPFMSAKSITENGRHKLLLQYPLDTEQVLVKVGMSAVDENGAQNNLDTEIPHFNFEAVQNAADKMWEKELKKTTFHSTNRELLINYYSAIYHSYLNPNLFSDVDGRYRGMDKQIHSLDPEFDAQYTVFSLWDTFRAAHPLYTITQTEKTNYFIRTFSRQYEQGKDMPVWELAGNETECMIGYHSVSVIADAYVKGIRSYDDRLLFKGMLETSTNADFAKDFYSANGYVSLNKEAESVSKTLEYAYDDYCIAQMAKAMGNKEMEAKYLNRSLNFINQYDKTTGFFRARRSGMWFAPFDPTEVNFNYTEANAWQYSLFAPHAVGVMSKLHGGDSGLEAHLDRLFTADSKTTGRNQADITGLIGQYAHGNEPSHHMAYLYNYIGQYHKAQKQLDQILKEMYRPEPDGLSGNEDCGQMSAWYALSALGLYQVAPGNPIYDFGRPICDSASISLENGRIFKINCINQGVENKYITKAKWNGVELDRMYLKHAELIQGGELEFTLSDKPMFDGKFKPTPTIQEIPSSFTPVPSISPSNRVFENKMTFHMELPFASSNYGVEYSINGAEWSTYKTAKELTQTTAVRARTKNLKTNEYSAMVEANYVKKSTDLTLVLKTEFANQYAAGGKDALIDGIEGESDFRTGDWQGFYNNDVVAEVQLKEAKNDLVVRFGVLEDLKSWIFFPTSFTIEISYDGVQFEEAIAEKTSHNPKEYRASSVERIERTVHGNQPIKALRLTVKNAGSCPVWHLGAGYPTWLFLDEINISDKKSN